MITRSNIPSKASGIYQIQSISKKKRYIGSACHLKYRKQGHLYDLRKQEHDNMYLQKHYNKYGVNDLMFSIIEFCSKENLIKREQYWINKLNPEFNLSKTAGSNLGTRHSKKSKINHANAMHRRIKNETKEEYELRCQKCREIKLRSLKQNPEQKLKISESLKKYYKEHPEYREFQKKYRKGMSSGIKNPMYGKTVYDVWKERYGEEEAKRKKVEHNQKLSKTMKIVRVLKKENYKKVRQSPALKMMKG